MNNCLKYLVRFITVAAALFILFCAVVLLVGIPVVLSWISQWIQVPSFIVTTAQVFVWGGIVVALALILGANLKYRSFLREQKAANEDVAAQDNRVDEGRRSIGDDRGSSSGNLPSRS